MAAYASISRRLLAAVVQDDLVQVCNLLKQGAQPNQARWAPLSVAMSGPVAKELLDHGASVEKTGDGVAHTHFCGHHRTPLHWAAYNGHGDVVEQLLDYGADPLAVTPKLHFTPLDLAQKQGKKQAVELLKKAVASVEKDEAHVNNSNEPQECGLEFNVLLQHQLLQATHSPQIQHKNNKMTV